MAYKSINSKFKKIKLNEFQACVNWEIFAIELIPGIERLFVDN